MNDQLSQPFLNIVTIRNRHKKKVYKEDSEGKPPILELSVVYLFLDVETYATKAIVINKLW